MSLDPVRNFAKVEVGTGYAAGATSIELVSGDGAKLPDPSTDGSFNLVWFDSTTYPDPADDPNKEIVRCTGRTSDVLTVVRAQEGIHWRTLEDSMRQMLACGGLLLLTYQPVYAQDTTARQLYEWLIPKNQRVENIQNELGPVVI